MRCYACGRLSWNILCDACKKQLFKPTIGTRTVGTLDVVSFYKYTALEPLLLTKHTPQGYRIYKELAKMTLKPFIEEFIEHDDGDVYIVGIDEVVQNGYAHVALLSRSMKTPHTIPLHASLLAQNRVQYAGKDLQFRLNNPRDFIYTGKEILM